MISDIEKGIYVDGFCGDKFFGWNLYRSRSGN